MGGREAYLASLIPTKINIAVKLYTLHASTISIRSTFIELNRFHEFINKFLEITYEDDYSSPKQLDCISLKSFKEYAQL